MLSGVRPHAGGSIGLPSIALVGPLDVRRLVYGLNLAAIGPEAVPTGPDGAHPVTDLVLGLAGNAVRLNLVTLDSAVESVHEFRGDLVSLSVCPSRPRARSRSKDLFREERRYVADRVRAAQPDVVSAHWTYEYALGALDAGYPCLITVHDWAPSILWSMRDKYRAVRLVMQLLTFARGRDFAAVSPYMARRVQRLTRRRVDVLPNGLDASWLDGDRSDLASRDVVAVNHGFSRHKNVHALLAAWPEVLRRCPEARLLLAGRDFEKAGIAQQWSEQHCPSKNVFFLGPIERETFRKLLKTARVFVHPSLEESFGMVALEAMASGVPVIAGDKSGAIPWVVGEAGRLINVRDPSKIAANVLDFLEDDAACHSAADAGLERARRFGVGVVARSYLQRLSGIANS
jgi:L-malate glycosyltransferase